MRHLLFAAALAAAVPAGAASAAESFSADYAVSLFGLPIARSSFTTTIDGDRYEVSGSLSSAGVAQFFDDAKGTTAASGRFADGSVQPDSYVVSYTSGRKQKRTEIGFSGGDVTHTENVPPLKQRKNWVALAEGDLQSVADPISATLIKASSAGEVCNRTLKIYDGEMRADLQLARLSKDLLWPGEHGEGTVACLARFTPVSGYRKGRDSIEFLRDKSRIMIAFAPLGQTGVYAPVQASVGTEIGTIRIEARRRGR